MEYMGIYIYIHHFGSPCVFSRRRTVQSEVHPNRELGLGLGHYPWMVYGGDVSLVHGGVPGMVDDVVPKTVRDKASNRKPHSGWFMCFFYWILGMYPVDEWSCSYV